MSRRDVRSVVVDPVLGGDLGDRVFGVAMKESTLNVRRSICRTWNARTRRVVLLLSQLRERLQVENPNQAVRRRKFLWDVRMRKINKASKGK